MIREPTHAQIAEWLRRVVEPDSVIELRILECVDNPKFGSFTVAGYFDSEHLDELASDAMYWTRKAAGCYVTINPVKPCLLARAANRVVVRTRQTTADADVERRVGLVFDVDPVRPAGISATDEEKALARACIDRLVADLTGRGWPVPILADSGNGFHARYRVALANNEGASELVKRVLKGAAARFSDDRVTIDTALFNPARIIRLYGTASRKGDDRPDRPHRWAGVISSPDTFCVVPVELLEALAAEVQPSGPMHEPGANGEAHGGSWRAPVTGGATPEARARAYVFAPGFPDSIAGRRGHDRLFHVACVLVDGFGLSFDQALPIFQDWNQAKAHPPEAEKQVQHKLRGAIKKRPVPSLSLLNAGRNGAPSESAAAPPTGSPLWRPLRFSELPSVEPFPLDVLPGPVARFVREGAAAIGCPPDFLAVPALAVAGGAIGRSASLRLKDGYFASATIFAACIGPPSDGKTPALDSVAQAIRRIDDTLSDEHDQAMARWEEEAARLEGRNGKKTQLPPKPKPRRIDIDDATMEVLPLLLADNPRGLVMVRDELTAFLLGMNQYKAAGKGNDRAVALKLWAGKSIIKDRVNHENRVPVRCPHPRLSMVGGIVPDMVTAMVDPKGRVDGLLDRFLFCYPDQLPVPGWSDRGIPDDVVESWCKLVTRLWKRPLAAKDGRSVPHVVRFTSAGKGSWRECYARHVAEMNDPGFPPSLRGPWGKFREYAGRLALVLVLLEHAAEPNADEYGVPEVGAGRVEAAWRLVSYFKSHARRVHAAIARGPSNPYAKSVVDWIKRHGFTTFRESEVREHLRWFRDHPEDLSAALDSLKALRAIRLKCEPSAQSKRGPKPSPAYEVHPDLLGAPDNSADSVISAPEPPSEPISGNGGNNGRSQDCESGEASEREVFEL
jgi:hypothetical protein